MLPADLINLILRYHNFKYICSIYAGTSENIHENGMYNKQSHGGANYIYIRKLGDLILNDIIWSSSYNGEKYLYVIEHVGALPLQPQSNVEHYEDGRGTIAGRIADENGFKTVMTNYRVDILLTNERRTKFSQYHFDPEFDCLYDFDKSILEPDEIEAYISEAKICYPAENFN